MSIFELSDIVENEVFSIPVTNYCLVLKKVDS